MSSLDLYVVTINCGCALVDPAALASQLFDGVQGALPSLLAISIQEIAEVYASFIGGTYIAEHNQRIQHAVDMATKARQSDGEEYTLVKGLNKGMTGLFLFALDVDAVRELQESSVGLGKWGMGEKGAVGLRFIYNEGDASTELTVVAAHLSAGEGAVERRNENWRDLVRGMIFSSGGKSQTTTTEEEPLLHQTQESSIYKPTSHLFLAGDLNYRTSKTKPSPQDVAATFPQPNQPTDSSRYQLALLPQDELRAERLAGNTLHGLVEAEINFPPTYKYESHGPFLTKDEDLDEWKWAQHRWPSWCDRILYLDTPKWLDDQDSKEYKIKVHSYKALPLMPSTDHRGVVSLFSVPLRPIPLPAEDDEDTDVRMSPPFSIDPSWRLKRDMARKVELIVGVTLGLFTTLEGLVLVGSTGAAIGLAVYMCR